MPSLREAWRTGKRVTSKTTGSIKWAQRVAKDYELEVSVPVLKALRHAYAVGWQDGKDEQAPIAQEVEAGT